MRAHPDPSTTHAFVRKGLGVYERYSGHYDENGRVVRHWKPGERRSLYWRFYEWRSRRLAARAG